MAGGLIQLSPEELLAQSAEMSSLQAEYENLFSGVGTILGNINESWSPNLANNFIGKIGTAKNAFLNLTSLLQQGAALAMSSARSFTTADKANAALVSGAENMLSGLAGAGIGSFSASHSGSSGMWDKWEAQINAAGESLDWLDGQYDKIPESLRKRIEELIPDDAEAAWRVTKAIVRGDYSWDILKDVFVGSGGDKDHASIITGILGTGFEQLFDENSTVRHLENASYELSDMAKSARARGDYGEAIYDTFLGEVLMPATESAYIGFKWGVDAFTSTITKAADGAVQVATDLGKGFGAAVNLIPGCEDVGNFIINSAETVNNLGSKATSTIKQVFNVETAVQWWADTRNWW